MNLPDTLRQLSFIRYLFTQAQAQIRQPYPQSIAAVLTLHDCVELFLDLAAQQPGVTFTIQKPNFDEYWKMQLPGGQSLDHRISMGKVNRLRVDFKHHGIWPALQELGPTLTWVTDFLEDSTQLVFGRDFRSFSMMDLVESPSSKQDLQRAAAALQTGQVPEAMAALAYASHDLIQARYEYEATHPHQQNRWRRRRIQTAAGLSIAYTREGEFLEQLEAQVNEAHQGLEVIGWGFDYPRFLRFKSLIPDIVWSRPLLDREHSRTLPSRLDPPTVEDCHFCFDFVIECALQLQSLPVY